MYRQFKDHINLQFVGNLLQIVLPKVRAQAPRSVVVNKMQKRHHPLSRVTEKIIKFRAELYLSNHSQQLDHNWIPIQLPRVAQHIYHPHPVLLIQDLCLLRIPLVLVLKDPVSLSDILHYQGLIENCTVANKETVISVEGFAFLLFVMFEIRRLYCHMTISACFFLVQYLVGRS